MNFQDYLRQHGYPKDLSADDRKTAYDTYRKWYKREYQKAKRRDHKRLELFLDDSEWHLLERQARKHQQSPTAFTKACIRGYLEQMYIVPDDATVRELEIGMRRIGNNINQLVMHTHTHKSLSEQTIRTLRSQLTQLERFLSRQFREPKNLNTLVIEALKTHPNYARVLQRLIDRAK